MPLSNSHVSQQNNQFDLIVVGSGAAGLYAAWRTESRGGHYRHDYPQSSSNWQFHTSIQGDRIYSSGEFCHRDSDTEIARANHNPAYQI